jgi:oligopeptide transport system ATP-binding protein
MPDNNVIEARDVSKSFRIGPRRRLHALRHVSLTVERGRTRGLVGESGCGKSTLARLLTLLDKPDSGDVLLNGESLTRLSSAGRRQARRRVQLVFQDPYASVNPRLPVREIIAEPWRAQGERMSRSERERRVRELMGLVGLSAGYAERLPHEMSGGQLQRVGIARALALGPDVIVCDEPVSALDLSIRAQVLNVLQELQESLGVAYVFISHDLSVIRHVSDDVTVMYLGTVVEEGPALSVLGAPRHPYTVALMSATPTMDAASRARPRIVLRGELPSPSRPPSGCPFRTRCWKAVEKCAAETPRLTASDDTGHRVACFFPEPAEVGSGRSIDADARQNQPSDSRRTP